MRIVSKFHDYYDSVQKLGMDKSVVFIRKNVLHEPNIPELSEMLSYLKKGLINIGYHALFIKIHLGYIYFCGKLFPIAYCDHTYTSGYTYREGEYFHTYEKLLGFLTGLLSNKTLKRDSIIYGTLLRILSKSHPFSENIKLHFSSVRNLSKEEDLYLKEKRVCIALFLKRDEDLYFEENPCLKALGFQRVMNPQQAYQNLDMYISGVLGMNTREPLPISDNDRLVQHGFDKRSFRKDPDFSKKRNKHLL